MKLYRDQMKGVTRITCYFDMGYGKTYLGSEKPMRLGNNLVMRRKSRGVKSL